MGIKGRERCEGLGKARTVREDYRSVRECEEGSDKRRLRTPGGCETLDRSARCRVKRKGGRK